MAWPPGCNPCNDPCIALPSSFDNGCVDIAIAPAAGAKKNVRVPCCLEDLPDKLNATVSSACDLSKQNVVLLTWDECNSQWRGSGRLCNGGLGLVLTLHCSSNGFCLTISGCGNPFSRLADGAGTCNPFSQTWSNVCLGRACCPTRICAGCDDLLLPCILNFDAQYNFNGFIVPDFNVSVNLSGELVFDPSIGIWRGCVPTGLIDGFIGPLYLGLNFSASGAGCGITGVRANSDCFTAGCTTTTSGFTLVASSCDPFMLQAPLHLSFGGCGDNAVVTIYE